ncbi:hypothetical protein [Thauera sp. GDN1]|uniref:hypothetical protein n=1 Tax=Thauera sp. GDN1 TaxID=2944810 RepID=UPI00247887F9|nr:hypothetical protein [Thauera sp. GDN1]
MRYIELDPVRVGMVGHPGACRRSSCRANARGEEDAPIRPHPVFAALGGDRRTCAERYRELFRHALEPGEVDRIRAATKGNHALGNDRFAAQLAGVLGRRVTRGKAGCPPRGSEVELSGEWFK